MRNAILTTIMAILCVAILFPAMAQSQARADRPALGGKSAPPVLRVFKLALPAGWTRDAKLSTITRAHLAKAGFFAEHIPGPDGAADTGKDSAPVYQSGADSFSPAEGMLFHVTWASGLEASHQPAAVVRSELDRIKQSWCGEGERERISWRESAVEQVADVRLEWKDVDTDLLTLRRSLVYVTTERRPRLVSAECILRGDVVEAMRPLCQRVLNTLAVTEPRRMAIVDLPKSTLGDSCDDPGPTDAEGADTTDVDLDKYPVRPSARIGDAPVDAKTGNVLYAGDAPSKKHNTQKYFFVIGGLLLVIAIYMTTRSRENDNKHDDDDSKHDDDDSKHDDDDSKHDDDSDDTSDREEQS